MFTPKFNRLAGLSLILSSLVIAGCATSDVSPEQSKQSNVIDLSEGVTDKYFATFIASCRDKILDNQELVDNIYYRFASQEDRSIFKAAKMTNASMINAKSKTRVADLLDQTITNYGGDNNPTFTTWYYGYIRHYDKENEMAKVEFAIDKPSNDRSKYKYSNAGNFRKNKMYFDWESGVFSRTLSDNNEAIHRSLGSNGGRREDRILPYVLDFSSDLKIPNYRAPRGVKYDSSDAPLLMNKSAVYTLKLVEAETKDWPKYLLKMKPVGCELEEYKAGGWGGGNYKFLTLKLEVYEYKVYSDSDSKFSEEDLIYTSS